MNRRSYLRPASTIFVVFVAIAFFMAGRSTGSQQAALAQTSPQPTNTPNPDGDPVGFDLLPTDNPTSTLQVSGDGVCLSSLPKPTCNVVEVHYLTNPGPGCPTSVLPGNLACTAGNPRALPTCGPNERCFLFPSMGATALDQDDDGYLHTEPPTTTQVLVIFRQDGSGGKSAHARR
jgi:hypothetical protein